MSQDQSFNNLTLDELLQKARDTQNKITLTQDKLANASVIGVAGDQDVEIKITGKYNVVSTTISDRVLKDKENLGRLITIAINDAMRKLELIVEEE